MLPYFFKRKRENILFILIVVIILGVALFDLALFPLKSKWQNLNNEILISKTNFSRYSRILMQKDLIEKEYKIYADYLKTKDSPEETIVNLLQEIETIATSSGVSLVNIVPSVIEEEDYFKQFNMRIELETKMASLIKFLYQIQESAQLFKIEGLRILAKGPMGQLRCNIRLNKIFIP